MGPRRMAAQVALPLIPSLLLQPEAQSQLHNKMISFIIFFCFDFNWGGGEEGGFLSSMWMKGAGMVDSVVVPSLLLHLPLFSSRKMTF